VGFDVVAPHGLEILERADTVVVPGTDAQDGFSPRVLASLRDAYERGARVLSICTGAFVLAHAGLLDGKRATTHWRDAPALSARFPLVTVDPAVLYVDEGQVLTSAGVAAGLDLCLHVIRGDHGAEVAAGIARRTVVAPHRDGGQAQYVERPLVDTPTGVVSLEPTRTWALERLGEPLTVATLARHAAVSPRTFARHFRAETGTTPAQWLIEHRILAARQLLEDSDTPIETVAARCGFATTTSFREHFRRRLATTPTAYRRTFRQSD
jgi:AraC family transcriptional regulator, transcriptional activator FtrA